ncbi:MAG: ribonuclease H-like domain-containing protein, partial [Burkholderiales bacterium]
DLPGVEAPGAWRRWLERGDGSLLERVLDHNRADLLSLAALLARMEHPTRTEAPLLHAAA